MSILGLAESWSKWFQGISLLGLGFVPLMLVRTTATHPVIESQPQIVGVSFITICILGAIVGIRPSACYVPSSLGSKQPDQRANVESDQSKKESARRGHHYPCRDYSTHVLNIGESTFCAGCTGLATGAAFAIVGSVLYFIIGVTIVAAEFVFWTGFAGVAVGIVQHRLYRVLGNPSGFFRFMLNIVFVNGAFLLLISADQLVGSFALDSYILLVILFWIYTRIVMSKSEHRRICSECGDKMCHSMQSFIN